MEPKATTASEEGEGEKSNNSLFPLFPTNNSSFTPEGSQWLSNTSFNTDLAIVNEAVVAEAYNKDDDDEQGAEDEPQFSPSGVKLSTSYELVEEESYDGETERKKETRRKKKKRKRSKEIGEDFDSISSTKSRDYYFDSHGDRDNLVYGRLYRYLINFHIC